MALNIPAIGKNAPPRPLDTSSINRVFLQGLGCNPIHDNLKRGDFEMMLKRFLK